MASSNVTGCVRLSRFFVKNSLRFHSTPLQRYRCGITLSNTFSSSSEPKEEKSTGISEVEAQLKAEIENVSLKLKEATEKCNILDDKYKRSLADGENLRHRLQKQIEDAKIFSIQGFCKDLLEVSDILQRATESVPKEQVTDSNPYLKSLYEGLTMTEAQLQSVFRRHGLTAINPLEEKFNPNYHEALFQQEVQGKEAGTVVVVSKIGYKLHERVIRPALVGVAKGS